MKKLAFGVLAMMIVISITACGTGNETSINDTANEIESAETDSQNQQTNASFDILGLLHTITTDTTIRDIESAIGFPGEILYEIEYRGGFEKAQAWYFGENDSIRFEVAYFEGVEEFSGMVINQGEIKHARINANGYPELCYIPSLVLSEALTEFEGPRGGILSREELLNMTSGFEGIPISFDSVMHGMHLEMGFSQFMWTSDTHFLIARREYSLARQHQGFEDGDEVWFVMRFVEIFRP